MTIQKNSLVEVPIHLKNVRGEGEARTRINVLTLLAPAR